MSDSDSERGEERLDLLQWSNEDFVKLRTLLVQAYGDSEHIRALFQRAIPDAAMAGEINWNASAMDMWRQVLEAARDAAILPRLLSLVISDPTRMAYWTKIEGLCGRLRVPVERHVVVPPPPSWRTLVVAGVGLGAAALLYHFVTPRPADPTRQDGGGVVSAVPQVTSAVSSSPSPPPPPTALRYEDARPRGPHQGTLVMLGAELAAPTLADGVILVPSKNERAAVLLTDTPPKLGEPAKVTADAAEIAGAIDKLTDDGLLAIAATSPSLEKQANAVRVRLCVAQVKGAMATIQPSRHGACGRLNDAKLKLVRCEGLGAKLPTESVQLEGWRKDLANCP
jgi:hypothetical protein